MIYLSNKRKTSQTDTISKIYNVMTEELSSLDWEDILDTLQQQKCILFLGSGAYKSPGTPNIEAALSDWLDAKNPDNPLIHFYSSDGFFLFRKNRFKRRVISKIKEFYNQPFPEIEEEFKKLAQIPFNMILSITPDNILTRTFDLAGFDYHSDFYFRHRKAPDFFEKPTKEKPLIYNLLGNIEEPESIILTHGDFFDYLNSVFIGSSMNADLRFELENAERYIFLGLPYEKWYFQLLLRILSMHSDKLKEIERLALTEFAHPHLRELYTEEFKIEFIPSNLSLFIEQLHAKCEEANILKEKTSNTPTNEASHHISISSIRELIGKNQTEEAINNLKIIFSSGGTKNQQNLNNLTILHNRFNILKQRYKIGTIYHQDFMVENNQVVEQLIGLISKVELA